METSSLIKSLDKKRTFKGNTAMDEDGAELPSANELSEREKRRLAREEQKLTGRKVRVSKGGGKSGTAKNPMDVDATF